MSSRTTTAAFLFRDAFRPLVEFIYPPLCFVCESRLPDGRSRVCSTCWSDIRPVLPDDQLFREMQERLTQSTTSQVPHLLSLFHFEKDGTLQSIIHQLKYDGMTVLGIELGRLLGEKLMTQFAGYSIHGIVPVPLHPAKLRERGYNQSEQVARGIKEVIDIPVFASLLRRKKYTASQTKLTAMERKMNVGDAFIVNTRDLAAVEGKTLVLVDDVITTGATIEACASALLKTGSAKVIAASVALADHRLALP